MEDWEIFDQLLLSPSTQISNNDCYSKTPLEWVLEKPRRSNSVTGDTVALLDKLFAKGASLLCKDSSESSLLTTIYYYDETMIIYLLTVRYPVHLPPRIIDVVLCEPFTSLCVCRAGKQETALLRDLIPSFAQDNIGNDWPRDVFWRHLDVIFAVNSLFFQNEAIPLLIQSNLSDDSLQKAIHERYRMFPSLKSLSVSYIRYYLSSFSQGVSIIPALKGLNILLPQYLVDELCLNKLFNDSCSGLEYAQSNSCFKKTIENVIGHGCRGLSPNGNYVGIDSHTELYSDEYDQDNDMPYMCLDDKYGDYDDY